MSALTKIFIVLMLVCALVGSVVLMVGVSRMEPLKTDNEKLRISQAAALAAAQAKSNQLEAVLAEKDRVVKDATVNDAAWKSKYEKEKTDRENAEIQRDEAKAQIETVNNRASQLAAASESMSKQLETAISENRRLAPENVKLTSQNAELARQNNELVTQVRYAEQTIRKLQEEIARLELAQGSKGGAAAPAETGAVASLSIQTPVQINGKVTDVQQSAGRTLIEMKLGTRDGVHVGTQFVVSRDSKYIGDVQVEKVTPDACVAVTTTLKSGEAVKIGDIVTSGSPQ